MSKRAVRREAREALRALTPEARTHAGVEVARRVWTLPEVASAGTLLLFAALPQEVPTDAIAHAAWERGVRVLYPRCLPDTREMVLHHVREAAELLEGGKYGIREPHPGCPVADPGAVDAALIPGLAWDRRGGRLGRGAGYYDRLLGGPGWRGFRCGLFFAAQEVERVPLDPWDVPLHAVVTEREVWRPGG